MYLARIEPDEPGFDFRTFECPKCKHSESVVVRPSSPTRHQPGKRSMFSPAVLLQVRSFVDQGLSAVEIAEKLGCTLGTLRVKCSQSGISLRRWNASAATSKSNLQKRLMIRIPENVAIGLQQQADKKGVSQADLVVALLDAIVRDNLYDAVIDRDIDPRAHKASRVPRRSKS
jgi:hypothetical protein